MILSISQLQKNYGQTPILKNITFTIENKDKIAIVGVNGAGKTTLFKLIAGQELPDGGSLNFAKNATVAYLSQNLDLNPELTLQETLTEVFSNVISMEEEMHQLEKQMKEDHSKELLNRYDRLTQAFQSQDGYSYKSRIQGVIKGLGFTEEDQQKPVQYLSGGQKTRLCLGKLLLSEPDLLLLDEPTNHLDIDAIAWLEGYLKSYRKALMIISHDRYFIDEVATTIVEIEHGKSTIYKGNYHHYSEAKKINRNIELKHYLDQQKLIKKQEESIAQLKSFNREKSIKRAESKEKQLEKLEKLERPEALPQHIRLQFQPQRDSGFEVLRVRDLKKSFIEPLFDHLSFDVKKGDRIAIVGPNGVGKTTLFKILMHQLYPDHGTITFGSRVDVAYYDQEHSSLDLSKTIFDDVHDAYPLMTNGDIRSALAAFQFKGEDVFKEISVLSGGEKGRVVLCKLLLKQANFLLLDEPTNHLDIQSKEVLEDALDGFDGTLLFISHDRYFINKIANKILIFESNKATVIEGGFNDYLSYRNRKQPVIEQKSNSSSFEEMVSRRKMENDVRKVERQIERLEEELANLQSQLNLEEVINDYHKYNEITDHIHTLEVQLEQLMDEWETLSNRL